MKKKVSEQILFVLCWLQVLGLAFTYKPGTPWWHYLLAIPPLFVGWYLDTFCHIFGGQEEEKESEEGDESISCL